MKKFLDLNKRLKFFREYLGMSQAEIAQDSGVAAKEISLMESAGRKTLVDQYVIYLHEKGLDLNWLYFGTGAMLIWENARASNVPAEGYVGQRRLGAGVGADQGRPVIVKEKKAESGKASSFRERINISPPGTAGGNGEGFSAIKVINQDAASAYPAMYQDAEFWADLPEARLPFIRNPEHFYIMVQATDEAMLPVIHHGDWIVARLINDAADIREGYIHLIVTRTGGIFARQVLNRIEQRNALALKSYNYQEHPTYNEDISNILQIWRAEYYISASFSNPAEDIHKRLNRLETEISTLKGNRNFHL